MVEDVAELPLQEARDVLALLRAGPPEHLERSRRAHRVHRRPEVAPRGVQRVRAAVSRPPAHTRGDVTTYRPRDLTHACTHGERLNAALAACPGLWGCAKPQNFRPAGSGYP